jgi:mono/diheme cytochrome c family protein
VRSTFRNAGWLSRCACALVCISVTACDIGGGGGGGPSDSPIPPRAVRQSTRSPDPVVRGALLYQRQGCRLCHGEAGKGGVANPNCETAGKINGLTLVKEGYSADELVDKIGDGQQEVGKDNKQGPTPPLRMPVYRELLSKQELTDLAAYLFSLYPKGAQSAKDDWDKDDSEADDDSSDDTDTKAPASPKKAPPKAGAAAKAPVKGETK